MPFDFKKEYKEYYLPPTKPGIVQVPAMNFVAVRGQGDPNQGDGAYQDAIGLLYGVAFTIKMSPKAGHAMEGYFEYVVPPLEGFWWIDGLDGMDYARKADLQWISCIRLPKFVTREEFDWAVGEAARKKKLDFSAVEFMTLEEGLCVQCMHLGPYDTEPTTVDAMHAYLAEQDLELDFSKVRRHHEIYLSDARRTAPEKLKTVIRHPVRKR
ncbi:MAG: GyrI-like domain-containing protein [Atopobiaceae bacterium]|nr:GyrI-like domain-containing protein [Atopobiaceae bacterium]